MPAKRKSTVSYNTRFKRARMQMRTQAGYRKLLSRNLPPRFGGPKVRYAVLTKRVNQLYGMIETKEMTFKIETAQPLGAGTTYYLKHNDVYNVPIQPFRCAQGAADAMGEGLQANRIGDKVTIRGLSIRGMMHNTPDRPKVYYRIMLLRCAKGDTVDRSTLFKNCCDNKMVDQVNTERFSIIGQKVFNCQASNGGGAPVVNGVPQGFMVAGQCTRTFSMWIPGSKIVRNGNLQYENNAFQPKFFDYKIVVLAYDHTNSLQDTSNVGFINVLYTKCYFKDA